MELTRDKLLRGFSKAEKSQADQLTFECLRAFIKLVRLMKSSSFSDQWSRIYDMAWHKLKASQSYIEKVSLAEDAPHPGGGHTREQTPEKDKYNEENSPVLIEEIKVEVEEAQNNVED